MSDVLQHDVVLIGLKEIKFKVGAVLTPIKGAMELTIDLQGQTQLVEGDDGVIAYAAEKTYAKITVTEAILSVDARAALLGDTATESGTTPNTILTYEIKSGLVPSGTLTGKVSYVKNITGATATLPKDAHFVIPSFTVDPSTVSESTKINEKGTYKFSGVAIPDSSGVIYKILLHETDTDIT